MPVTLPDVLRDAFRDPGPAQRILVLARLSLAPSFVARETCRPGSDDVDDPVRLRRIAELSHRVATRQLQLIESGEPGMPEATFLTFLAAALDEIGVRPHALARLLAIGYAEASGDRGDRM